MKKLSTMAILAVSAASAFAADYTVVKSGEWYQSGVFGDGVTAPVATSEETAIDNLSFASSGLSLKLTGGNAGLYFGRFCFRSADSGNYHKFNLADSAYRQHHGRRKLQAYAQLRQKGHHDR